MKTIKEWFDTLPEPYKSQAIKNTTDLDAQESSLSRALKFAFVWDYTPEDFYYWMDVCNKAEDTSAILEYQISGAWTFVGIYPNVMIASASLGNDTMNYRIVDSFGRVLKLFAS